MENVHICLLIKCLQVFTVNPSDTVAEERQRGGGLRTHTHTQANVWFRSNNSLEKIVDGGEKSHRQAGRGEKKFKSAFYPRPIILSGPVCLNGSSGNN